MINFIPGQFTELSIKDVGSHWFTISSAPESDHFSITTRLTGSEYKDALNSLRPGDILDAAEPMGDFVLPQDTSRAILMVAGGIGITPFLSILKSGLDKGVKHQLHMLYAASSEADFVDLSPYKKLLITYDQKIGRLEAKDILRLSSKLSQPYIYTSGPEPMVEAIVKHLRKNHVPEDSLISDYFPGYE